MMPSHLHVLNTATTSSFEQKGIEFDFPLYWAVGGPSGMNNVPLFLSRHNPSTQCRFFPTKPDGEAGLIIGWIRFRGASATRIVGRCRGQPEYLWLFEKHRNPL